MVNTLKTNKKSALLKKLKKQAGFTLAELLIVVAIIAVLAAVAIPVYAAQMTAAQQRVDEAALSSATSVAATDYLMQERTGTQVYRVYQSSVTTTAGNRNVLASIETTAPSGYEAYVFSNPANTGFDIQIGPGGAIVASLIT